MRLDHLLSKEEVGAVLLFSCQGADGPDTVLAHERSKRHLLFLVADTRAYRHLRDRKNEIFLVAIRPGETPVPIPNTMVKPRTADGTVLETIWESRRLPENMGL